MTSAYNVPEVERESTSGVRQISLLTQAFSKRRIFLFGEITEASVYGFTMQLMALMEESKAPINIYINSPGGEVGAGLAIYDLMQSCEAPLNVYCIGLAASMAAIILAGGRKGHRYILPHSTVMIHEPLITGGVGGSASTIKNTAESILQTRALLNGILARHTGKTQAEIDAATDHDNCMKAKEAIAFGLCDEIVTQIL